VDSRWRVLVVSPDAECCQQFVEFLTQWKMESILAADHAEAEVVLEKQRVELVFCDSDLPEDGFRRVLHFTSTRKQPVPVVALVHAERGYEEATLLGAFDVIPLPCQRSDVQWVVIRAMRDQQDRRRESKTRDVSLRTEVSGSDQSKKRGQHSTISMESSADRPTRPADATKPSSGAKEPIKAAKSEMGHFYRC
jgi:DNA-binding NtrC family response regulator